MCLAKNNNFLPFIRPIVPVLLGLLIASGCVARRGTHFGHWARAPEHIHFARFERSPSFNPLSGGESILLLPALGIANPENQRIFQAHLLLALRTYLPAHIATLDTTEQLARFASADNLTPVGDMLQVGEIGRIGALAGATHVCAVQVSEFRPYVPQLIALRLTLIDTRNAQVTGRLTGTFNAAEQQVVLALSNFLQARRALEHSEESLGIMLRSPNEFSAFVGATCGSLLAKALWEPDACPNNRVISSIAKGAADL